MKNMNLKKELEQVLAYVQSAYGWLQNYYQTQKSFSIEIAKDKLEKATRILEKILQKLGEDT